MTAAAGSRDQAVWQLFPDRCAALDCRPLPADPMTLARFISANPATVSTQHRRVGVINAVHRRVGHLPPGCAETVRELLDARHSARMQRRTTAATAAIERLRAEGWPTALFARRDAMLRVRSIQHHLPSTRRVAACLRGEPVPELGAAPNELPLVTPIDRWGATPLLPTALSAASVSRIVTGHLTRSSAPHRPIANAQPTADARTVSDPPDRLLADLLLLPDGPGTPKRQGRDTA